jgi:hypothetical protein
MVFMTPSFVDPNPNVNPTLRHMEEAHLGLSWPTNSQAWALEAQVVCGKGMGTFSNLPLAYICPSPFAQQTNDS